MDSKAMWVYPSAISKTWGSFSEHLDKYVDQLATTATSIFGFSVHSDNRLCSALMIKKLKDARPDVKIIAGGMGVTSIDERNTFPKGLVDFFVVGEGENTLLELVHALKNGNETIDIKGVAAWTGQEYSEPVKRPWAKSLDDFTSPTFEQFDLSLYSTPNLPILTSRGCKNGCVICNDRILMGKYRSASAQKIFDSVIYYIEELGVRDFMFNDLQVNANLEEIDKFCSMIIDAGQEIRWNGNAIVDDAITLDLLKNFAAAGCHTLDLGLESGSPKVIKSMNKGFTVEQAIPLMTDIKAAGIMLWINLVIGFPTETEEDFVETMEFVKTHAGLIDAVAVMNTCNILDHSILSKRKEKYGIANPVDPDWFEVNWRTLDGANTPTVRLDRQNKMIALLKDSNIEIRQSNVAFEDEQTHISKEVHALAMVLAPPYDVNMPPYEFAVTAGFLESKGEKTLALDLNIEIYKNAPSNLVNLWESGIRDAWAAPKNFESYKEKLGFDFDRIADRILSVNSQNIYFHATTANINFLIEVAKIIRIKAPEKKIIYGGPSTKIKEERKRLTDDIADYLIIGHTAPSLLDLLERIESGRSLRHIRGVMYTLDDGNKHFIPREPVKNLDLLGFPTFTQLKPDRYAWPKLPIVMSRGCVFRCAFCAEQLEQGAFRTRSPESVFKEMVSHFLTWDIFTFEFMDLIINSDPPTLEKLCDLIIESDYSFKWSGQVSPRQEMTEKLFKKMSKAGCQSLTFGVESLSDDILKSMNKTYTGDIALQNLHYAHEQGIKTHINLMVGWPNEDNHDFYNTAKLIKERAYAIDFVDMISAPHIPKGSLLEKKPDDWRLFLPEGNYYDAWDQRGRNNKPWREKRVMEMAVYMAGLPIKFNYDFFVPPKHSLRKIETRIRERFEKHIEPDPVVLLVTTPPWGFENPPVGLAYLSTYLKHHGIPCETMDFNIEFYNSVFDIYKMLWHVENKNYWSHYQTSEVVKYSLNAQIDRAVQKIFEVNPPLIGFSVVDPKEKMTIEFIVRLRSQGYTGKIILGGPACHTPDYRQIFIDAIDELIDGYCVGEGEETLLECAQRVEKGMDLVAVPGLMWLDENDQCRLIDRPIIEDLNSIPFPTYEEFNFDDYPGDSLILEWSRGCIGNCTYCKGREISGKYRTRSAENIFMELKYHYEENGYDNFTICDNLLNGTPDVLNALCDMIIEANLPVRWNGEGIPLPSMTADLFNKMKKAGCYEFQLGIESGADPVLKRMGKSRFFTAEQGARVVRDCHEAGIKTCLFTIVGFPGETDEDFDKTLSFIDRNAKWIDQIKSINSLHVITDTPIHKHADKFGLTLPEVDYHYLWVDKNGLDFEKRNQRIRKILALCQKHDIEVRETNLAEGKQYSLAREIGAGKLSLDQQMEKMIKQINKLDSFDAGDAKGELNLANEPVTTTTETENIDKSDNSDAKSSKEMVPVPREFIDDNLQIAGAINGKAVYAGPEILEIDVANACNANCVGCWNHSDLLGDDKFTGELFRQRLPADLIIKTIDKAAELGGKMVQLSGAGEPFMHPEIMKIIKRVKHHGLKCVIITNLTLVDKKKAARLVELGVDEITVSVWAGTAGMYELTHPKLKGNTINKIRETLRFIHKEKTRLGKNYPHIKIYNVISKINADGIRDMVQFAIDSLADYIEFTPIDIIPGKTDSLALDSVSREIIAKQLKDLPGRDDFIELEPTIEKGKAVQGKEVKEFARFVKKELFSHWFKYELEDISRFDVLCPRKEWRLDVKEDNSIENALLFYYPQDECQNCPLAPKCPIDKKRYAVKVEFLSVLGYGPFYRRITSPEAEKGKYDSTVKDLPCLIGWTYTRLLTDGNLIPCCKGDNMLMGNIKEEGFKKVWTSEKYSEFRAKAKTIKKDDPFFDPINCLVACDNLGQNLMTLERIRNLDKNRKEALKSPDPKDMQR